MLYSNEKITPFLRLDDKAEEAAEFCVSIFGYSWVRNVRPVWRGEARRRKRWSIIQCGWLGEVRDLVADRAGHTRANAAPPDPVKSQRVMKATLGMIEVDIADPNRAY